MAERQVKDPGRIAFGFSNIFHLFQVPILDCAIGGAICQRERARVELKTANLLVRQIKVSDLFVGLHIPDSERAVVRARSDPLGIRGHL